MSTLRAIDGFGSYQQADFVDQRLAELDLYNGINWVPVIFGDFGGAARMQLAQNADQVTDTFRTVMYYRGLAEVCGAGVWFKPLDWAADSLRSYSIIEAPTPIIPEDPDRVHAA